MNILSHYHLNLDHMKLSQFEVALTLYLQRSRHMSKVVVLLLALAVSLSSSKSNNKNVLVMVADDEGIESPLYGNPKIKTPNLQELASRSVLFKNAYTSVSSNSPSRLVIMTGLPQHQNGMYGMEHAEHHFRSFDNVKSLPRILNETKKSTGQASLARDLWPQSLSTLLATLVQSKMATI